MNNRSRQFTGNKPKKPQNVEVGLDMVYMPSMNAKQQYTDESMHDLLCNINDNVIPILNVNINMARSHVFDDPSLKGTISVGYLISYDKDTERMKVGIFARNGHIVDRFNSTLKLVPNCIVKNECAIKITDFELIVDSFDDDEEDPE